MLLEVNENRITRETFSESNLHESYSRSNNIQSLGLPEGTQATDIKWRATRKKRNFGTYVQNLKEEST